MKPIPLWGECGLLSSLISEQKLRVCGVPMVGGVAAQRRGSGEEFMENADATSGQIFTMDRPDIDT